MKHGLSGKRSTGGGGALGAGTIGCFRLPPAALIRRRSRLYGVSGVTWQADLHWQVDLPFVSAPFGDSDNVGTPLRRTWLGTPRRTAASCSPPVRRATS